MPNCAAPPNKNNFGFESSGPKSIIAPIPIKSTSGIISFISIPIAKRLLITPSAPENGMLIRIAPNPIGNNSAGSISFLIARKINSAPRHHIITCCQVTAAMVSYKNSINPPKKYGKTAEQSCQL